MLYIFNLTKFNFRKYLTITIKFNRNSLNNRILNFNKNAWISRVGAKVGEITYKGITYTQEEWLNRK